MGGGSRGVSSALYWVLAFGLIAFGAIAAFSIGIPLLAAGLALVALAPFRGRPAVFWPWLVGVLSFFVGYVLVAPVACFAGETVVVFDTNGAGGVVCTSLAGIQYTGLPGYHAPRWPGAVAGLATALGAGLVVRLAARRRADARDAAWLVSRE